MYDVYKTYSETKPSKQKITGKAILLGESGVGKTCIIKRLVDNIFNMITPTTFGSSATEKKYFFNNTELKLDIWDTAGQEIYRSLNHIFYRDANIVLLVYDITNRRSFEEMKTYWFRQIEKSCEIEDPRIAANKCDLFDHVEIEEKEGKEFALSVGAIFQETSANKDMGIEDLFEKLARKYVITSLKGNDSKGREEKNSVALHRRTSSKKKKCCNK